MQEPAAPPPTAMSIEEPGAPPPQLLATDSGSDGAMAEATQWFEQKFTLSLCGKHVSSSAARALIVGFGAIIVVLLVVMTTMTSSSDSPQDSGAVVPPSAGKSVSSGEQAACAAPPAVTGARYTISPDGMVATYECSQSFSLRGATQLRCTACDSGPEWTVSGTRGSCNRQEAGPACAQLSPAIVSTPPPSPPSPSGAPVSACIDDATCDTLVSQLGCTHDPCHLCVRESWLDVIASVNELADSRGRPPADPISSVEFYFGTQLPEHASLGAILDDGTGFAWQRAGSGLSYGWDCDGDARVDYSGGRRGLDRDNGLGINHFDRDGTCGTTENPGRVSWQLAVPNGEYKATVDFGESIPRTDVGGASLACEVEGELVCPGTSVGQTDCLLLDEPVIITDGFFTITGYSTLTGACHSVSLVRLEHVDYSELCPVAPGTAAGTVNIGDASTHDSGDCSQHSWGHCDAEFDSPACNPENIYEGDGRLVGIAYAQQSSMPQWDGVYVSSCLEVGFGAQIMADGIRVLGAASDEQVCGVSCTGEYCGTSGALHVYTSAEDTPSMPDYMTFTYTGTVDLPLDTAAIQGDGVHHDTYDGILAFDPKVVKWAAVCRSGGGGARDHIVLDTVELKPIAGGSCSSAAAGAPAPPLNVEFYFGTEVPSGACPEGGCTVVLDDGTGFSRGRQDGLDYGWDCDGDANVDFSGGRRGLDRDNGLGINHFDRDGVCPGPVNWQLAVPNGVYQATVDFGEHEGAYQHGCAIEGDVQCPGGEDCLVTKPIEVTDGRFTVTGYSHDAGTCHSISLVKLVVGRCHRPLVVNGLMGADPQEHGGDWSSGSDAEGGYITQQGTGTFLRFDMPTEAATGDWTSTMKIVLTNLDGSAATFEFNRNSHFGFEGACQCVFAEGPFYGDFQNMGDPAPLGVVEGAVLDFVVQRSGATFTISVNGNVVQTHTSSEPITSIGLRPHRATMRLYDWTVDWCRQILADYAAQSEGVCTPLQMAVITHCQEDCDSCDDTNVETVLAGCAVDGVQQVKGVTFCQVQCTAAQTQRVTSCQQDCDMCELRHIDFLRRVGFCVLDDGSGGWQTASSIIDETVASCGVPTITCGQTVTGSTRNARNELGIDDCHEVTHECGQPSGENKFLVTADPTRDTLVQFDSCNSVYDTYLHLVTVDPWLKTMNSCDDCGGCGTRTVLDTELEAGQQYYLYIEGYDTEEGDYSVTMNCPTQAIGFLDGALSCGQTVRGNTVGEGSHIGNGASDHIYTFTAPATGTGITFNSCESEFDTHLRVYDPQLETDPSCQTEAACPQYERAECDDCGDCGTRTVLTTSTDPNENSAVTQRYYLPPGDYLLVVEGYDEDEGQYAVEMICH